MALRLLIFVPSHTDAVAIHHELTVNLCKDLSQKIEVRLAVSSDKESYADIDDYDIIHIFGCWSRSATQLASKAYAMRKPYVVTPLGGLQPWEMEHHHANTLIMRQQQTFIKRAAAVQVCGKLEMETFTKLAWNHKTALIKNPVLTSQTTFGKAADSLLNLYRKVIDSNVRILFSEDQQQLIGDLLQLGVDAHAFDETERVDQVRSAIGALTTEDWRRILIYAHDEQISDTIMHALEGLQIQPPTVAVGDIDRFDLTRGYAEGSLSTDKLLPKGLILRNKVKELYAERSLQEKAICTAFLNFQYEINHKRAPLRHLSDLYSLLRYTDMDEDAVAEMLHDLKIDDFAREMMAVLEQFMHLTEGFMLASTKDGHTARRLLKAITKFGMYI